MKKMLIVYYSWSNGNTKKIAEQLQAATGADIARIETAKPYPEDYQTTVEQGQDEVEKKYMPPIRPLEKNPADYDVIAIGTPTWWYTMAPAVLSFIHQCNVDGSLYGKTIIPFSTHGGWPGHTISDICNYAADTKFVLPIKIQFDSNGGDKMIAPPSGVRAWVSKVAEFLNDEG